MDGRKREVDGRTGWSSAKGRTGVRLCVRARRRRGFAGSLGLGVWCNCMGGIRWVRVTRASCFVWLRPALIWTGHLQPLVGAFPFPLPCCRVGLGWVWTLDSPSLTSSCPPEPYSSSLHEVLLTSGSMASEILSLQFQMKRSVPSTELRHLNFSRFRIFAGCLRSGSMFQHKDSF